MSFVVTSSTLVGVEAKPVAVEVDILQRLPSTVIVGIPHGATKESADRVRSAIQSEGFDWPKRRVVVNLSPADLRKTAPPAFDLPIAIGVLGATEQVPTGRINRTAFIGELSLEGALRPIRGALAHAEAARDAGATALVLPAENAAEAALVEGLQVFGMRRLKDVCDWLAGYEYTPTLHAGPVVDFDAERDMALCHATPETRDVLLVAALGGVACPLRLVGPAGCGATMLAARLAGLRPVMTPEEAREVIRVHSVAGLRPLAPESAQRSAQRPFRAPHHTISPAGMIGNAALPPGEVSLAHNGVLFLDEYAEFPRHVRDALASPLKAGTVRVSGARLPAAAQLVVSVRPCPCGARNIIGKPCLCDLDILARCQRRIQAPGGVFTLELRLRPPLAAVPALPRDVDRSEANPDSSAAMRARVTRAAAKLAAAPAFPLVLTEASCDWLRSRINPEDRAALSWVGRVRQVATWAHALGVGVLAAETAELDTLKWAAAHVPFEGAIRRDE